MIKKIKKRIEFALLVIVVFQVLLLINMTTANSYIIHQTDSLIENQKVMNKRKDKFKNLINSGINLLIGFLSIKQIGIVSAQEDVVWYCCADTCDPIISINTEGCTNVIETSCENTAECKLVCCFDPENGLCTPNSPKGKCIADGGEWDDDESCSIDKCRKGCCVLGSNVKFRTERNCEYIGGEFKQIWNEQECFAFVASQFEGACVLEGGACKFTTEDNCVNNLDGTPHTGYLCSHPNLNTNCENQTSIGCDGEDEIYWFDSCGNRENIYSSNRQQSWNNGMVLSKEESCDDGNGNINSETCGNCARPLSICSETGTGETHVEDGNYVCKDLGCKNAPANVGTQDRIHSETWCLYDGYVGDGKDTAGSEHWVAHCWEGEIKVEKVDRCGEHRGYVCQESIIEEDGRTYSTASCVPNDASMCRTYNPKIDEDMDEEEIEELMEEMNTLCNANTHCMIKNIDVDNYFKFDVCVPRYPKGADLADGMDDNICGMANRVCIVYYKKKLAGWKCMENCDCETNEFAEQMNDFCISLGDCGSYINYIGKGTDNVKIEGKKGKKLDSDGKEKDKESKGKGDAPNIYSWTNYIGNENPVAGQYVEPKNIDEFLSLIGGSGGDYDPADWGNALKWIGGISGATGTLIHGGAGLAGIKLGAAATTTLGSILTVTACAAIGAAVGSWLAKWLGISGGEAIIMIVAGGIVGLMAGLIVIGVDVPVVGWIVAILAAVVIIFMAIFGIGKRETRIVEFTCMPWQAPTGEAECEKCNEDPLKPCTEYKCNSIGQVCKFLNEGIINPTCESIPHESNPPIISPGEVYTDGYEFQNEETKRVEIKSEREDGCIQEWTSVYFKLKTDEPAQCKWSLEQPELPNYDKMGGDYPLEQNAFTINHSFEIPISSLDGLGVYDVTGDLIEMFGNMNMYVKCQDYWENYNIDEYIVKFCINSGPDQTAVDHTRTVTDPENGDIVKYGTNETYLTMWINEPADCKWTYDTDKSYDLMENNMTCDSSLTKPHIYGWPCSTTLTNLIGGENKFYIKCKDKPWVDELTEEEITRFIEEYGEEYLERNVNEDDYEYILYVSESELKIDSIIFDSIASGGTILSGFEPISVDLEITTSGGMDNGKSECKWGVLEEGNRWLFYDTFSNVHKQTLTDRMSGTHVIYIDCVDEAGNEANAVAQFIIEVDSDAPKVVRVYHKGGELKLITDEEAKCYYDFNRCSFSINDETLEFDSTGYSTEHTTEWITGQTYYIKCKNLFGNVNPGCAIKVKLSS